MILFSLLVLEKFAQTLENKFIIERFIAEEGAIDGHPLRALEEWVDETDLIRRQVGFCAQWALDNVFILPDRELSYLKVSYESKFTSGKYPCQGSIALRTFFS